MEQAGLYFEKWCTAVEEQQALRAAILDGSLEAKYSRPLDQVPLHALRKDAADFLIGNLPFNHAEEAWFWSS